MTTTGNFNSGGWSIEKEIEGQKVSLSPKILQRAYKEKLVKIQEILGLSITLERVLTCRPSSKEFKEIKRIKEAIERADNLTIENKDMERRMVSLNEDLSFYKHEINSLKEKHGQQVINYKKTIDQLKEM